MLGCGIRVQQLPHITKDKFLHGLKLIRTSYLLLYALRRWQSQIIGFFPKKSDIYRHWGTWEFEIDTSEILP